ncbi:MAG: hypothetical protein COT89_01160 [Candidatus Colwellbacteria bacterium CG10_big_fil_rev_8_21_14_0_10_42_22]|uniref:Phosphatidic acid phosphatase type 2/haloperoxidase domain-containing protein n=1 Tax=Candidatus Colwellbacteria bacterium CG10_big_fil_rev_8_21_14_0_10_42_22 TaxID=1974540 RepID=A0A2H0VG19_9BACT|nr:MAG: hypothetical protein COT89_01160 [Candidatus Colwellbacteria bacterium CG10_big_fil_rev_8_21_14_0_10_42_22]
MQTFNEQVFNYLFSLAHRSAILDGFFIFFAKYLPWLIIVLVLIKLFNKKNWKNDRPLWKNRFQYLSLGVIAVIFSRGVIANALETIITSPRPFIALEIEPLFNHLAENSLPSGHMAFLIPIALTAFLLSRKLGWFSLISVLLIGVSRVIAGIHWPADILVGILIGTIIFYLTLFIFKRRNLI